jgi:hypothetical protein
VSPGRAALVLAPAAVLLAIASLRPGNDANAGVATPTTIGIDAIVEGNSADALGPIDDCAEISVGDSHEIDVYVTDVTDLLAWEADLVFNPDILEVTAVDTTIFLATSPGSDAQDVSQTGSADEGRLQLAGFDAADPLAPDSGSGQLARLTFKAKAAGVSALELPLPDLDGDGNPDKGPLLQDADANPIGDTNGDTFFDGQVSAAKLAVDASCQDAPTSGDGEGDETPPQDSADDDSGIDALTVIAIVAGLAGALAVGGLAVVLATRARSRGGD